MVEGDSANEKLSGKNINFKLGIVGICNRNQKQLDDGISIDKIAQLEQRYFSKNYPDFANKCGIKYLIKRMNEVFFFIFLNISIDFSYSWNKSKLTCPG